MKIDIKYHYRTGTHCWYCDREYATSVSKYDTPGTPLMRTKDHILSKHHGGINNERNYIGCCSDCNIMKGLKNLRVFAMHLRIQPLDHSMSRYIKKMINRAWKLHNKFSKEGLTTEVQ